MIEVRILCKPFEPVKKHMCKAHTTVRKWGTRGIQPVSKLVESVTKLIEPLSKLIEPDTKFRKPSI